MKKLVIILMLLFPAFAFSGDITTFQNFGSLKLTIPSPPTNQSDATATYMIATAIIPDDGTIIGDLYDADDNLIARKRVYAFSGGYKNIPFGDLNAGQQGYLSGQEPADKWEVATIKLWMDDRQTKDADGLVNVDDPYKYAEKDTKEDLLGKVDTSSVSILESK